MYSPVLRVPLIAKVPGNAPRRISGALSITDLNAALLQNLDDPSKPFRLLDRQRHRPVISDYLIVTPMSVEGGFSFVDDRFQYIRWNDGREAIFDRDGREVSVASQAAWAAAPRDIVSRANAPNLGIGIDSYHILATQTLIDDLDLLDPGKIYLVQLADFMWQEVRTVEERVTTARHFRVFPGEGVHSSALADLVRRLDRLGYGGDYSFEVFNDDYQQMPLPIVAERARRAAMWLCEDVLRRAAPIPTRQRRRAGERD